MVVLVVSLAGSRLAAKAKQRAELETQRRHRLRRACDAFLQHSQFSALMPSLLSLEGVGASDLRRQVAAYVRKESSSQSFSLCFPPLGELSLHSCFYFRLLLLLHLVSLFCPCCYL